MMTDARLAELEAMAAEISSTTPTTLVGATAHHASLIVLELVSALRSARRDAETLREALQEISEGNGRYSREPLVHAVNTIEDMKALALNALQSVSSSPPIMEKNDR